MTRIAWAAALVATAFLTTAQAATQDADMKELAAYRLTKAGLDKYRASMQGVTKALLADPRLQEAGRLEAEREKLESRDELTAADEARLEQIAARLEAIEAETELPFGEGSLSDIEASLRRRPAVAGAIQAAGFTPREFTTFTLVLFQASMAAGMQKAGLLKELPKEIAKENVEFVLKHEAEIAQMQKDLEALVPADRR